MTQQLLRSIYEKGGPGSGNFGHAGRPGQVGGSGSHSTAGSKPKPKPSNKPKPKDDLKPENHPDNRQARSHLDHRMSRAKAKRTVLADLNCDKAKADRVMSAFEAYTRKGKYQSLRKGGSTAQEKKQYSLLEEYVNNAPTWDSKGTVYRGMKLPASTVDKLSVGASFDMKGMSSWSSEQSISFAFSGWHSKGKTRGVVFSCDKVDKGASIAHLSYFNEREVLLSKSCNFKVKSIKVDEKSGLTFVNVVEM